MITSSSNPKVKYLRSLRQRKARQSSGVVLVEGIHPVAQAVDTGSELEEIYYAPDLLTSEYARGIVENLEQRGIPCLALASNVFTSVAEKENPQGILAVVRLPKWHLEQLNPANFHWGVAVVAAQDPGNVGTILRNIDAVGASGLLLLDEGVEVGHPSVVRASMGALFGMPVAQSSFAKFETWVKEHGYHLYGSSAHAQKEYSQVEVYEYPCILLLGSERQGLNVQQSAACEMLVRLPMLGRVSSLNLGVAAGVLLYDMLAKSNTKVKKA